MLLLKSLVDMEAPDTTLPIFEGTSGIFKSNAGDYIPLRTSPL